MNYEILDIETAKKIARLERENKELKEENKILKNRIKLGLDYVRDYGITYNIKNKSIDEFSTYASPSKLSNILEGVE